MSPAFFRSANGGTGSGTQAGAILNLLPAITGNGQLIISSSGNWVLTTKCAVSTCIPSFNGGGTFGYIQTPIPVVDGGIGLGTLTLNTVYAGNGASPIVATSIQDNGTDVLIGEPVIGHNSVRLTSPTSITSTGGSYTSTGLVLPIIPTSTTISGRCSLIWEQNTGAGGVTFGVGMNNAPTDLWIAGPTIWNGTAVSIGAYTTITNTTTTAITSSITPAATATGYKVEFDFTLQTAGLNPGTLTVYGLTGNASDALIVEPGSFCAYHP